MVWRGQIFKRGEQIEPKDQDQLPLGSAYRSEVRFLELDEEGTIEFYENEGQKYEVRWLGFGYSLVTPVEMSAECGTPEEENGEIAYKGVGNPAKWEPWYRELKTVSTPFIVWNGEENAYTNRLPEVV